MNDERLRAFRQLMGLHRHRAAAVRTWHWDGERIAMGESARSIVCPYVLRSYECRRPEHTGVVTGVGSQRWVVAQTHTPVVSGVSCSATTAGGCPSSNSAVAPFVHKRFPLPPEYPLPSFPTQRLYAGRPARRRESDIHRPRRESTRPWRRASSCTFDSRATSAGTASSRREGPPEDLHRVPAIDPIGLTRPLVTRELGAGRGVDRELGSTLRARRVPGGETLPIPKPRGLSPVSGWHRELTTIPRDRLSPKASVV